MVHLFYPADAKSSGAQALYVPDADAMRGPWNDAQVALITALRAYSHEHAALPCGKARYPVLVFMPCGVTKVQAVARSANAEGRKLRHRFPAHSYTMLKLKLV